MFTHLQKEARYARLGLCCKLGADEPPAQRACSASLLSAATLASLAYQIAQETLLVDLKEVGLLALNVGGNAISVACDIQQLAIRPDVPMPGKLELGECPVPGLQFGSQIAAVKASDGALAIRVPFAANSLFHRRLPF
jgi:hypothetical protein